MLSFMSHACFPAPFKLMAQAWDKGSAAGPGGVSCTTPDSAEHSAEAGGRGLTMDGVSSQECTEDLNFGVLAGDDSAGAAL